MIYGADGYATALDKNVAILPISDDNYETLMRGKTLEEYVEFFQENFGEAVPELAVRWKARMAAEQIKEEEAKAEEAEAQDSENIPEEKPEPCQEDRPPERTTPAAGCRRSCCTACRKRYGSGRTSGGRYNDCP